MDSLFENIKVEIVALVVLLVGFVTTFIITPKLIAIIRHTNLMDHADERSSHTVKTPTLGGISFYISLIFGLFTIHFFGYDGSSLYVIVGLTILFFVGLKDDIMVLSAFTKLMAQLLAVSFVLILPDLWITSFSGFLGIGDIPLYIGILISYFLMIFIINAYNLIDGIDGLAGLLGFLIFTIFGFLFYLAGNYFYFLLCILSIGFLAAFLRFNLSKKNKIFMGDTGSLVVGFLIAIMTIHFLAMPDQMYEQILLNPVHKFVIALSIIFFPTADVSRVILMRLLNNRGPFEPDRCHMHHILVDRGLSHKKASITLAICGAIIFTIIYLFNMAVSPWGLLAIFILLYLMTFSILLLLDYDDKATTYRKRFKAMFSRDIQVLEFRIRKKIIFILKRLFYRDM